MTTLVALVTLFACIGAWRLWNYEEVFLPVRKLMGKRAWLKPLWCVECNPFWIALTLTAAGVLAWPFWPVRVVMASLAVYPFIRVIPWIAHCVNACVWSLAKRAQTAPPATTENLAATPPAIWAPTPVTQAPPEPGCTSCEASRVKMEAEQARALGFRERVALLTLLGDFHPSYSLTTVILNQARMLAEGHPDRLVVIFVMHGCSLDLLPKDLPGNIEVRAEIPPPAYGNDAVDGPTIARLAQLLQYSLIRLGNATIITHDILFQSAFINHAAAIHQIADLPSFAWMHLAHSCAGRTRPPEPVAKYRATLPAGHRLIALTTAEVPYLAAYYATQPDRVVVIPNARDMGDFSGASPRVRELAGRYRLGEADIVQIYPVSSTRLGAKNASMVARILGVLHTMGSSVRLVIANPHANGNVGQAQIAEVKAAAKAEGLPEESLIFTSEALPDTQAYGLPQADIAALMAYSNLFIFPSVSEACPLVLAEAALAGCTLVTNSNVPNMAEIVPHACCLPFSFGSEREQGIGVPLGKVAEAILQALDNPANRAKRRVLRHQSFAAVSGHLEAALASAVRVEVAPA